MIRSRPRGLVDTTCPINWQHDLNVGLVMSLSCIPNSGWSGGRTWFDLVKGGKAPNNGTLTNMAFPASTTSGTRSVR